MIATLSAVAALKRRGFGLKMFGSNEAREARTLIIQHMRDCETDKREIKEALRVQNDEADQKHRENVARFGALDQKLQTNYVWLMRLIVAGLVTMVGSLAFQVIQDQKAPLPAIYSPAPPHR